MNIKTEQRGKRTVRRIVVHCSAGPTSTKATAIVSYHLRPTSQGGRGWKNPGYHYIVEGDGRVVATLPEELIANGAKGFNSDSIHICYTGGIGAGGKGADTRTAAQKESLRDLICEIRSRRGRLPVYGHRDLSPDRNGDGKISRDEWIKECPCFDARKEYGV